MNLKCREEIKQIYDLMGDDKSREIFANRLLYSLTGDKRYIRKVILSNRNTNECIARLYEAQMPIAIFGAGMWGKFLVNAFDDIRFFCFIDNHRAGQTEAGLPVYSLEQFLERYNDAVVVIAVKLYHAEIYGQLINAGILQEDIIDIGSVWEKMTHLQYFEFPDLDQYNLSDGVFVDGGSYDGMTSVDYVQAWGGVKHVYAWEPDPDNQAKCRRTFEKYHIPYELIGKGMWDKEERVKFCQDNTGSVIAADGNIEIETAMVDEYTNRKVTFIKLDLEGAEYRALIGARKTICHDKPILAVCIYHKPEDIWEIPMLIRSYYPNCKFYLRHYAFSMSETVLYAMPEQ